MVRASSKWKFPTEKYYYSVLIIINTLQCHMTLQPFLRWPSKQFFDSMEFNFLKGGSTPFHHCTNKIHQHSYDSAPQRNLLSTYRNAENRQPGDATEPEW
jgi:hypothetical protein